MKQPECIGKYEVLEEIGRGGMGIVYKALHPVLERYVAIKVLPEYLARQDPDFRTRFLREARIMVDLNHPGVVRVIDADSWEGAMFLVMEFVDGWTIRQVMSGIDARGRKPPIDLTVDRSIGILQQVSGALGYAHEKGIIHRDVKPSNILIDKSGHVWITDFGIAKSLSSTTMATQAGVSLGTPEYMAPEQFSEGSRSQIDRRADIYSLGCVFYEMVTGKTPFEGETPLGVAYKHVNLPCPHPRQFNPAISPALEQIILKMLAKSRDERYDSCESLREDLLLLKRGDSDHILTRDGTVDVAEPARVVLGVVELTSEPVGARVYVDGKYVGLAPLTREGLSLGPHNAVFVLRGREEVRSSFELAADSPYAVVNAALGTEVRSDADHVSEHSKGEVTGATESSQITGSVALEPDITSTLTSVPASEPTTEVAKPFGDSSLEDTSSASAAEAATAAVTTNEAPTLSVRSDVAHQNSDEERAGQQDSTESQPARLRSRRTIASVAVAALVLIAAMVVISVTAQRPHLTAQIGVVSLVSPFDGATTAPGRITLSWSAAGGAVKHQVVVRSQSGEMLLNMSVSGTALTATLLEEETTTWMVRGIDLSGNWGNWAPARSLTVQSPTGTFGTVQVESDQPGTSVAADGSVSPTALPATLTLSSDVVHTLVFTKAGYKATERKVTVKTGETVKVSVTMERQPPTTASTTGSLYVVSSPSGARIYLNGRDSGEKTPSSLTDLAAGVYTVRCSLGGTYRDASQSVTVKTGASTSVNLPLVRVQSSAATIAVSSRPSQAIVYVDGNLWASMTPCSITGLVSGNTYTISIEKTGYLPSENKVTAKSGTTTVAVDLRSANTSATATLSITSSPSGALVFVNGILAGTTPFSGPSPAIGPVSILLEKSGYITESRVTVLQSGQQYELAVALTAEP